MVGQSAKFSGSEASKVNGPPGTVARSLRGWVPSARSVEYLAAALGIAAIVVSSIRYVSEADDRYQQTLDEAWQVISAAQGQPGTGGERRAALEFLNQERQDLTGVGAQASLLPAIDLEGGKLSGSNFQEAVLDGANFRGAALQEANFNRAHLGVLDGEKANLDEAILEDADMRGAYLIDANLPGAKLGDANLNGAILDRANLRGARLDDANLQEASLVNADLAGASLSGANLQDVDIRDANLQAAEGLTPDQIEQAIGDGDTRLPDYVDPPSSWDQGNEIPLRTLTDPPLPPQQYSSKVFKPTLSFTVGEGWRAFADTPDEVMLFTDYEGGAYIKTLTFLNVREVFDASDPAYDPNRPSLANTSPAPDDVARWLQAHPYLDTEERDEITIDGVAARQLDARVSTTPSNYPPDCARPCVPLFRISRFPWFALYEGYQIRLIILEVDGDPIVLSIESPAGEADAFLPKALEVVDSIRWKDVQ